MRDVQKQTKIRIQQLSQLGYRVKEMWECEWNCMIQADPQLKEFIHTDDIVTPLNPHEDFFGRRTNATVIKLKKPMSTFPRQINAEFFLGQIWTMPQPNPSHHMHQTQRILSNYHR